MRFALHSFPSVFLAEGWSASCSDSFLKHRMFIGLCASVVLCFFIEGVRILNERASAWFRAPCRSFFPCVAGGKRSLCPGAFVSAMRSTVVSESDSGYDSRRESHLGETGCSVLLFLVEIVELVRFSCTS